MSVQKKTVWTAPRPPEMRAAPGDGTYLKAAPPKRTRVVGFAKGLGKAGLWPADAAVDAYETLTGDSARGTEARRFLDGLRRHIDTAPTWEPDGLAAVGEAVGQIGGTLGIAGVAGRAWPLLTAPAEAVDAGRRADAERLATAERARNIYYDGEPPAGHDYFHEMLYGTTSRSDDSGEPYFDPAGTDPAWWRARAGAEVGAMAGGIAPYVVADLLGRFVVGAAKKRLLRQDADGGDARFSASRGMFATDKVPETIFGIPVVADANGYTKSDVEFFRKHPEAGGFYDMGDDEDVEDGSPEGAPVQTDMPRKVQGKYGLRPDDTPKGDGWLGPIKIVNPDGSTGVATEYSFGVRINGKETDIPSLVPTLTPEEVKLMQTDVIPNGKRVPDAIARKAIDFAKARVARGLGVWAPELDAGAAKFMADNPTLFGHVKSFEKLWLTPYDDIGGKAIGYGAHTDLDDLPVTAETRFSKHMADMRLARDLYARREKLRTTIPNWNLLPYKAKFALLDVSMGADNVLTEAKSEGLFKDLRSTRDPGQLTEYVKNHYYSYRNPDDANTKEGLEARRIAGGKLFFDDVFSYKGKIWDKTQNKFVPVNAGKEKTK